MNEPPEDAPPSLPEPTPSGPETEAEAKAGAQTGGTPAPAGGAPEPARPWPVRFIRAVFGFPGRLLRNAREIWRENTLVLVLVGFAFAFVVAIFWQSIFIKIGPGEAGVLYRLFFGGTVTEAETRLADGELIEVVTPKTTYYKEGLRVIFPWDTMYIYNLRLQQVPDSFFVLSKDGLAIKVEVSIRFRPEKAVLGLLHQRIGPDYIERVVKPDVQSVCRYVFGQYTPEEIYDTQGFITESIKQEARAQLAAHYVYLDDVLLRGVTLPPTVALAIESKLRAQQVLEEYQYRVESEKKEAERKSIEAGGILKFQDTVMSNLPDFEQYLRYKGIEATLELAKSPNSKIVIIGGGEDRLPIILDGTEKGEGSTAAGLSGNPRANSPSPRR